MLYRAQIMLLDEPTNHLDVKNVAWLVNYLTGLTEVTSVIVSHDSTFLDNVCQSIVHYENRKLRIYKVRSPCLALCCTPHRGFQMASSAALGIVLTDTCAGCAVLPGPSCVYTLGLSCHTLAAGQPERVCEEEARGTQLLRAQVRPGPEVHPARAWLPGGHQDQGPTHPQDDEGRLPVSLLPIALQLAPVVWEAGCRVHITAGRRAQ